MMVTGNDPDERKALQSYLSREFEMKDLGHLKYFVRIEVSQSNKGILVSKKICFRFVTGNWYVSTSTN